jgi:Tfp pilus assembly protein PilO
VKIGFGARIVLVIIVTLVACGYFGMAGVNADTEYQQGRTQIDKTMALIKKTAVDPAAPGLAVLQAERVRLEGEIKAALDLYPRDLDEASMIGRLLELAAADNVTIVTVSNQEASHKSDYYLFPTVRITVNIAGNAPNLIDFLSQVEGGRSGVEKLVLPDLAVSIASISRGKDLPEAQIAFTVYGKPAPLPPKKAPVAAAVKPKAV